MKITAGAAWLVACAGAHAQVQQAPGALGCAQGPNAPSSPTAASGSEVEQIIHDAPGHSKRGTVLPGSVRGTWTPDPAAHGQTSGNRWLNAPVTLPNHSGGSPLPDDQ